MAAANKTPFSTTAWFSTGNTPGMPVQTGQILVLGGSFHESALQEQKILVVVLSWMWVSSPITASYSIIKSLFAIETIRLGIHLGLFHPMHVLIDHRFPIALPTAVDNLH